MSSLAAAILRYRLTALLMDSNLLLLYAVGLYQREMIPSFRRVSHYACEDFDLVLRIAKGFRRHVTTPHILAEFSNLAIEGRPADQRLFPTLVRVLQSVHEFYIEEDILIASDLLARLGLADAGIAELARRERLLVLTDDHALKGHLQRRGHFAATMDDLRTGRWLNAN